jgi:hypothetical protein
MKGLDEEILLARYEENCDQAASTRTLRERTTGEDCRDRWRAPWRPWLEERHIAASISKHLFAHRLA